MKTHTHTHSELRDRHGQACPGTTDTVLTDLMDLNQKEEETFKIWMRGDVIPDTRKGKKRNRQRFSLQKFCFFTSQQPRGASFLPVVSPFTCLCSTSLLLLLWFLWLVFTWNPEEALSVCRSLNLGVWAQLSQGWSSSPEGVSWITYLSVCLSGRHVTVAGSSGSSKRTQQLLDQDGSQRVKHPVVLESDWRLVHSCSPESSRDLFVCEFQSHSL